MNPATHRLECSVRFRHLSGPEQLRAVDERIFRTCGKFSNNHTSSMLDIVYVSSLLADLTKNPAAHAWIATDATGEVRGYALGRKISDTRLHIDVLCTQNFMADDSCRGLGVHLMHQVVKSARRLGFTRVTLSAVRRAVKFYARIGFIPTTDPCHVTRLVNSGGPEVFMSKCVRSPSRAATLAARKAVRTLAR